MPGDAEARTVAPTTGQSEFDKLLTKIQESPLFEQIKAKLEANPDSVKAFVPLVLSQFRPVFANLYMLAKSARELHKAFEARQPSPTPRSAMMLMNFFTQQFSFGQFQILSGDAYATSLLLMIDSIFVSFRSIHQEGRGCDASGPFSGYPLWRVVHAATNHARHSHNWRKAKDIHSIPDVKLLEALGISVLSDPVCLSVLEAVGGSNYFDFEDQVNAALGELLTGKPTGVITFFDPAPATAPDAATG